MSTSQIESKIKSLSSEIEKLGRDYEAEVKREAGYRASIKRTTNSITKNTSASMLKSKQRSISSDNEKVTKSVKKQSDIQDKLTKKKAELAKKQAELQKVQNKAFQEISKKQESILKSQQQLVSQAEAVSRDTWHNVSKDVVKQYSPILADMLALKTAGFTIDELADEFIRLCR